jgi:hypothetical protein
MKTRPPTKAERERAERAKRRAVTNIEKELLALEKALPEWADVIVADVGETLFARQPELMQSFIGGCPGTTEEEKLKRHKNWLRKFGAHRKFGA